MASISTPYSPTKLGSRIGSYRREHKLSLRALEELTDISKSNLSAIENATEGFHITLKNFIKLAEAFEIEPSELLSQVLS